MKKMMKRYGKLTAQGEVYVLLRPLPFEPEYAIPGADAFYVGYYLNEPIWKDLSVSYFYSMPHIVYVKGGYVLDMDAEPEDVAVYVEEEKEAKPFSYIVNIEESMRNTSGDIFIS